MNTRTKPTINAPLSSLAAAQDQPPYSAFTHDLQQLYSLAMDQAIGMEQASYDAVLRMQSCVMEACDVSHYASNYEAATFFTPAFGNLLDLMAQTITSLMELQLAWLTMLTPCASQKTDNTVLQLHLPAPGRRVGNNAVANSAASNLRIMTHQPAEGLAHSMDIAIGALAA